MKFVPAKGFRGTFRLRGDKSLSHRLALFGALADGETTLRNYSSALDCAGTLACLKRLGVEIDVRVDRVTIRGRGPDAWRAADGALDCGNSGSTLRMLAGALAGRPFRTVLTGDASLRRRPMARVVDPLIAMGARAATNDGRPPLTVDGGPLHGIDARLDVPSAQVKTAILLAGLQARGTTTVRSPLASRDHSERLLPLFGAALETSEDGLAVSVAGPQALTPAAYEIPGDASSAAFLVVAGLIGGSPRGGGETRVEDVLLNPTRSAYLDVLDRMGGLIEVTRLRDSPEPAGTIVVRPSSLRGAEIGPEEVPLLADEIPALAVAAACAHGTTRLTGAEELRVKESDRLSALAAALGRMGARVDERPDGFVIEGRGTLEGAAVRSHGDHRIAMAMAVASLAAAGETEIEDAECASVSFPEFYELLALGRDAAASSADA